MVGQGEALLEDVCSRCPFVEVRRGMVEQEMETIVMVEERLRVCSSVCSCGPRRMTDDSLVAQKKGQPIGLEWNGGWNVGKALVAGIPDHENTVAVPWEMYFLRRDRGSAGWVRTGKVAWSEMEETQLVKCMMYILIGIALRDDNPQKTLSGDYRSDPQDEGVVAELDHHYSLLLNCS